MTAAELAGFRQLLQAQAAPRYEERGLLGRVRHLVAPQKPAEPGPSAAAAPRSARGAPIQLDLLLLEAEVETAAPLPRTPPRFGRREGDEGPAVLLTMGAPASREAVTLFAPAPAWDGLLATPDLAAEPSPAPTTPSPGVIAGWSRVRPPSAQRRILARLEAVFLAEAQGLDSRIAASPPSS